MKSKEMKRWLPNKKNRPVVKSLSVPTEEDGGDYQIRSRPFIS
jgi:hypothetical protein